MKILCYLQQYTARVARSRYRQIRLILDDAFLAHMQPLSAYHPSRVPFAAHQSFVKLLEDSGYVLWVEYSWYLLCHTHIDLL